MKKNKKEIETRVSREGEREGEGERERKRPTYTSYYNTLTIGQCIKSTNYSIGRKY